MTLSLEWGNVNRHDVGVTIGMPRGSPVSIRVGSDARAWRLARAAADLKL